MDGTEYGRLRIGCMLTRHAISTDMHVGLSFNILTHVTFRWYYSFHIGSYLILVLANGREIPICSSSASTALLASETLRNVQVFATLPFASYISYDHSQDSVRISSESFSRIRFISIISDTLSFLLASHHLFQTNLFTVLRIVLAVCPRTCVWVQEVQKLALSCKRIDS